MRCTGNEHYEKKVKGKEKSMESNEENKSGDKGGGMRSDNPRELEEKSVEYDKR
jgi:hypothetical protein